MSLQESSSKTILVRHRIFPETFAELSKIGKVHAPNPHPHFADSDFDELLQLADAFLAFMPDAIDTAWLSRAPRMRMIAGALKGYDNFDLEACTRRGVWVSNVPDLLTIPTAELAIGLMIGLARHVRAGDISIRERRHSKWEPSFYGTGIHGSSVGLIGMGLIGRAIAERLQGFGANLFYFDDKIVPEDIEQRLRLSRIPLSDLLPECDFLIVTLPLTPRTFHLLSDDALHRCKTGALLINPGRGSVVDEAAIVRALNSGRLGGYAADVFECEDTSIPTHPANIPEQLLEHPLTLFTPHLGSAVREVRQAIELRAVANIADWASGVSPRNAVNQPLGLASAQS